MEGSPVLKVAEVARLLRISLPTAYAAIHAGEIPHVRVGRKIYVPRAKFEDKFLRGLEV